MKKINVISFLMMSSISINAWSAIALDRTRVIYNGSEKSVSLNISNQNKELPYLAQVWIEDSNGKKINDPLTALPPLQRIEGGGKGQVKIQGLNIDQKLPQDKESVFYLNLREIPPRSNKPNTLQIALQTRIKLFYRPKTLFADRSLLDNPWQKKISLKKEGGKVKVINPTPYYVTLAAVYNSIDGKPVNGFDPIMVEPKSSSYLTGKSSALGSNPVLTFINDFGGRPKLIFNCSTDNCIVTDMKEG